MSGFASNQSRSSFRVNNESTGATNGQQQQQQLYNFPWDFKMKPNPILAQIANNTGTNGTTNTSATAPPPLPTVPPPKTPRISTGGQDEPPEQSEDQYCSPWDLKLQEEMLKRMALQKSKSGDDENKKPDASSTTNTISSSSELSTQQKVDTSVSSDYNMPWEMKQSILFQSLANGKPPPASTQPGMFPAQPLATSSAVSTLTTSNGTGFNKMSQSRLSTRSNASSTSSSSSRRSSTSSVSTNNNSPQQTMNAPPQPPSIPPPLPPNINTTSPAGSNQTSILSNHTSSSTLMNMSSNTTVNNSDQLHHQNNCAIMLQQQQQSQSQAAILSPRLSANARLSSNNSVLITTCNCSCISTINGGQSVGNKFNPINSTCLSNSSIHNFGGPDGHVLGSCGSSGTLNTSSSMTLDNDMSNPFNRQSRAGSSHHFPLSHFQTVATGGKKSLDNSGNIQVAALPITALIFSQNSLPSNLINIQSQQQQQQLFHQIASNQIVELQKYAWFHGSLTRKQAETLLANRPMGSFLVRQSESGNSNDCSLSLISGSGCVHMRICMKNGEFILGQCSQPFNSIVKMIDHYSRVEVPIKGAQHVKLTMPVPRM